MGHDEMSTNGSSIAEYPFNVANESSVDRAAESVHYNLRSEAKQGGSASRSSDHERRKERGGMSVDQSHPAEGDADSERRRGGAGLDPPRPKRASLPTTRGTKRRRLEPSVVANVDAVQGASTKEEPSSVGAAQEHQQQVEDESANVGHDFEQGPDDETIAAYLRDSHAQWTMQHQS